MTKVEIFDQQIDSIVKRLNKCIDTLENAVTIGDARQALMNLEKRCPLERDILARLSTFLSTKDEFDPDPKES